MTSVMAKFNDSKSVQFLPLVIHKFHHCMCYLRIKWLILGITFVGGGSIGVRISFAVFSDTSVSMNMSSSCDMWYKYNTYFQELQKAFPIGETRARKSRSRSLSPRNRSRE